MAIPPETASTQLIVHLSNAKSGMKHSGRDFIIKVTLEVSFPISDKEKFFGIENVQNEPTIDAINYILLTAKVFIWREKRWGKPCTLHDYLPYLREQILLDAATQTLKKKPFLMDLLDIT